MGSILANSSDNRWLSSQRSTARCMFSHISGLVFSKRASFKAVAAVTGCSSAKIRCRLWRDMLSRSASSEMDNPVDGRISAFSAAPGCVGLRLRSISDNPPGQPVSHLGLYGERNGSPANTVTYHETLLQSVQTGSAITIRRRCKNFCRKNTQHVVRNGPIRLNTNSASVLKTRKTVNAVRDFQGLTT